MTQIKMDKRLAGLPPREQARYRRADLYADDPWNNARVTRAFRRHRREMDFAAWNKGFRGNDILFADSVKNLLIIANTIQVHRLLNIIIYIIVASVSPEVVINFQNYTARMNIEQNRPLVFLRETIIIWPIPCLYHR